MKPVRWRLYEEGDEVQVRALHAEMESRLGHKLDLPNLLAEPVLLSLVGETDGKITHGVFLEAEAELCAIGVNPLSGNHLRTGEVVIAGHTFRNPEQALLAVMNGYRLRIVRSFVPSAMLAKEGERPTAIERTLKRMGMQQDDESLKTFFRWLPRSA